MKSASFWIVMLLLSSYLFIFDAQKIQLVTLDLGRHIINGDIMLHPEKFHVTRDALLHTNLFSFTYPNFPFVNHHWGSGVLLYLIYSISGWNGLSLFYIGLVILSFFILIYTVFDEVEVSDIFFGGLLLVPLIGERTEVRPEVLSYFFIAVFIYILYRFSKNKLSPTFLYILPLIELLWANSHIYFIFGPCLIFGFLCEALFYKDFAKAKQLALILGLTLLAACITPYSISGLLYPFTIFKNYGYLVAENQSIPFLEKLSFQNPNFLWFKVIASLTFLGTLFSVCMYRKQPQKIPIALIGIALVFGTLGFLGIRHLTAFGLTVLPLFLLCFSEFRKKILAHMDSVSVYVIYSCIALFIFIFSLSHFSHRLWSENEGIGLAPGSLSSAEFVKNASLHGPIFSNYDIGSYIIFNFFPKEKTFVDNRPEAFPTSFFQNTYIPMQTDDALWNTLSEKENFNMIYFYRLDLTPWAQNFLIHRVQDKAWAPVYVDNYTIIFLKRNAENKLAIQKYELPQNMFAVR